MCSDTEVHFLRMQLLELSRNKICTVDELELLVELPKLQRLVLINNPVAARSAAFTRVFTNVGITNVYVVAQTNSLGHEPSCKLCWPTLLEPT